MNKVIFSQDRIGKIKNRIILDVETNPNLSNAINFLAFFVMDETSVYIEHSLAVEYLKDLTGDEIREIIESFRKAKEDLVPLAKGKQ